MSTTGRPGTADPDALAERLASASFVKLVPRADGDAIAAAGTLARALEARTTPFQISVGRTRRGRRRRLQRGDDGLAVALGGLEGADLSVETREQPASVTAARVAARLDGLDEPELAIAGAVAAGSAPGEYAELLEKARSRGVTRRPGVSIPTTDLVDGLAHSTLFQAPFSGDRERAREVLETLDGAIDDPTVDDRRSVASLCAIEATDTAAPDRAATSISRAVAPYESPEAPFETVGGYADVLDAVARSQPGTAVALAIGGDVRDAALEAWRTHAVAVHDAVRSASTGRYDGVVVVRTDAASVDEPTEATSVPETVARLYRDVATVEPVVVAVGGRTVGLAALDGAGVRSPAIAVRDAVDGAADWSSSTGHVDASGSIDERTVVEAAREAV